MRSRFVVFVSSALMVLVCFSAARAEISMVKFDVFINKDLNNATVSDTLRFNIELTDNSGIRPPSAVDWSKPFRITIPTTPTPMVYNVRITDWEEWSNCFRPVLTAAATGGVIPTGVYKLTFTDKSNRSYVSTNSLTSNTFLPAPTITRSPTASNPRSLGWTKVTGAEYYRIMLKDLTSDEPVYGYPKQKDVYIASGLAPSFLFPVGVLRSGHIYQVSIEARDNDQDLSKSSRSLWNQFIAP